MIFVAVVIMVRVVVTPCPVFFLFFGRHLSKVASSVPMSLTGPLPVRNYFVVVPNVIVRVVRVVDAVVVMALRASQACCNQCGSQEKRDDRLEPGAHVFLREL